MPTIHQTKSPDNIRIDGRQAAHKIVWTTEPWLFLRALFLSLAQGGCAWCGNIPQVVAHPAGFKYGDLSRYYDFAKAGCYPMCVQCNNAEYAGKVLCPRCKRQGHYCPAGEVCWDCKPEELERVLANKDKWKRIRNRLNSEASKKAYQWKKAHPLR